MIVTFGSRDWSGFDEPISRLSTARWCRRNVELLRNSTCIGWLEGEAELCRQLGQRALLVLADEGGIAEFAGVERGAGLDYGVEDPREFASVGGSSCRRYWV